MGLTKLYLVFELSLRALEGRSLRLVELRVGRNKLQDLPATLPPQLEVRFLSRLQVAQVCRQFEGTSAESERFIHRIRSDRSQGLSTDAAELP